MWQGGTPLVVRCDWASGYYFIISKISEVKIECMIAVSGGAFLFSFPEAECAIQVCARHMPEKQQKTTSQPKERRSGGAIGR